MIDFFTLIAWISGIILVMNSYQFIKYAHRYTAPFKMVLLVSIGTSAVIFLRYSGWLTWPA